ncbi:MAG: hypothetical protein D6B25_06790 [Desulfobulbaceae bacterium]|nr:MAG: hypothetical protein D6B25_06790 [Desulfobulbaceae bacterium]
MSEIPASRIGFDFDGVIADIGSAFLEVACSRYGYCSVTLEQISSFQVEDSLNIPREVIEKIFQDILEDSIGTGLKPLPGAIDTITRISEASVVHVITARPMIDPVKDWFAYYSPRSVLDKLNLIATGDHDNKEQYIREFGLTHFIDDRVQTCEGLAASGLSALVYSQPWNQDQHSLPAVADWAEISVLLGFKHQEPGSS